MWCDVLDPVDELLVSKKAVAVLILVGGVIRGDVVTVLDTFVNNPLDGRFVDLAVLLSSINREDAGEVSEFPIEEGAKEVFPTKAHGG